MSAPVPDLDIQAAARLLAEGRPEDASSVLESLLEAAPAYAAGHVLLARAYEARGMAGAALEAWHRAHFLVPTSPLVRRERQALLDNAPPTEPAESPVDVIADVAPPPAEPGPEPAERSGEGDGPTAPTARALTDELAAGPTAEVQTTALDEIDDASEAAPRIEVAGAPLENAAELATDTDPPSPLDAVWEDDEPEAPEAAPPPVQTPSAGEAASGAPDPGTEEFEWSVTHPTGSVQVPPAPADSAIFAEDAFGEGRAHDDGTVFNTVPELTIDDAPRPARDDAHIDEAGEGWAMLDETDAERRPPAGASEASVAPPWGSDAWAIVPTGLPQPDPVVRPSTLEWDLDSLIREIEEAPRIRPDPHFVPPSGDEPDPDAREDDEVVSETLARIYEGQGQFAEAAEVYEILAAQRPEQSDELSQRAAELRARAGA